MTKCLMHNDSFISRGYSPSLLFVKSEIILLSICDLNNAFNRITYFGMMMEFNFPSKISFF